MWALLGHLTQGFCVQPQAKLRVDTSSRATGASLPLPPSPPAFMYFVSHPVGSGYNDNKGSLRCSLSPESGEYIQLVHLLGRVHTKVLLCPLILLWKQEQVGSLLRVTWKQQVWDEEEPALAQRVPGQLQKRKTKSCDERHRRKEKSQSFLAKGKDHFRPKGGVCRPGRAPRLLPPALRGCGLAGSAWRGDREKNGQARGRGSVWGDLGPGLGSAGQERRGAPGAGPAEGSRHAAALVWWCGCTRHSRISDRHLAGLGTDQDRLPGSSLWFPDETGLAELNCCN